jgi:thioredoxin-related protein
MEKETLLSEEVKEAIKDDFLTLDIDINEPSCKSFFEYYGINATPIYLFLTPEGDLLSKVMGYRQKDIFLDAVESSMENNINKNYIPIEHKKSQQHTKKIELKESKTLKVKVYPNPSSGNFKLDIQGEKGMGIIQFIDINGQFLLKVKRIQ